MDEEGTTRRWNVGGESKGLSAPADGISAVIPGWLSEMNPKWSGCLGYVGYEKDNKDLDTRMS
ncbi:hypothetical protein HPP92_027411 [Vanilla planifolia]|uniref:Uncharacterized protein n=1 Tax=Vanilla planifolia TaxID=51239 RepID=A0A835PC05_VANPL|nr:hypothetical protein HPP92_027411 [Vanilla planifolia]